MVTFFLTGFLKYLCGDKIITDMFFYLRTCEFSLCQSFALNLLILHNSVTLCLIYFMPYFFGYKMNYFPSDIDIY